MTALTFAAQYRSTGFAIGEYWFIGQVATLVNGNGANAVNLSLTDGAIWHETDSSLIASLVIEEEAQIVIPEGVTLAVNGVEYSSCIIPVRDA